MRDLERFIVLQTVDTRWREHLENMDYMREGIGLRGLAQKDPLVEYTAEGHVMFQDLNASIQEEVVMTLFHAEIEIDGGGEDFQQPTSPMSPNGDPSDMLITSMWCFTAQSIASSTTSVVPVQPKMRSAYRVAPGAVPGPTSQDSRARDAASYGPW